MSPPPAPPRHALVRAVSPTFAQALTRHAVPPDADAAAREHAAYVATLASLGLTIVALPADPAHPDACFVEDTAVIVDGRALVTRPGAPSRRGEVEAVATALAAYLPLTRVAAPATLDGGDCLRVGRRLYVGRSGRTDEGGVAALREAFPQLDVIPVATDDLHLQCSATALGDDRVLLAEGTIPREVFAGLDVVEVPAAEAFAANVVTVGRAVLVAADAPLTQACLRALGYDVRPVENRAIRAADGALTCMSLRW